MDILIPYVLPIAVLPLTIFLFFFFLKNDSRHPPGSSGWPMVGENIDFALRGAQKFVHDRMKKYSPDVFQTSLMGEKMAVFCGAAGNKFLFTNENKLVTSWWPKSLKKALSFPEYSEKPLKEVTIRVLKPESVQRYIPLMDSMAQEHLENHWAPHRHVKVFPLSKKYSFALACKLFMGIDDPEHVDRLANHFTVVTKGMFSVPIDLPGTAYNGAIKGGKLLRAELMKITKSRKEELTRSKSGQDETGGQDLLSQMLLMRDENGESMITDMEITNNIISLLVASYDTTSTAITFVLKYLAELPEVYDKVLKEQMEIAKSKCPGELLTWEDIQKMKYSWNMAREALRLTPPAQGAFREALTDFTYAGFNIPKGWKILWNVYTTHKNPKYFPNPEAFDPSRFEGNGPAPYTYVPFGSNITSYPDIGYEAFGRSGKIIVSIAMNTELYLVATGFLILEGDNLYNLFPHMEFEVAGLRFGGKQSLVIIVALIILPTIWLNNMSILSYISASGVLASGVILGSIFWAGAFDGIGFRAHDTTLVNWGGIPTATSLYAFCYCAHPVFPTLYTSMKNQRQFSKVLLVCFALCTITYSSMAVIGYLMFGSEVNSQVTLNLPTTKISSKVAIYTILVNPIAKYALMVTPIVSTIESRFHSYCNKRELSLLIRALLVASTVVVALAIPFFGSLMSLVGAFLSVTASITLPCLCYLKITGSYSRIGLETGLIWVIIVLGVVLAIVGTYTSLVEIIGHL